ncbi:hypothetical protein HK104_009542 [Borealophlyctis nickersoniae]|nr:hypothetical protein HK104_009542 [Borealophlyctis nickersoniae]
MDIIRDFLSLFRRILSLDRTDLNRIIEARVLIVCSNRDPAQYTARPKGYRGPALVHEFDKKHPAGSDDGGSPASAVLNLSPSTQSARSNNAPRLPAEIIISICEACSSFQTISRVRRCSRGTMALIKPSCFARSYVRYFVKPPGVAATHQSKAKSDQYFLRRNIRNQALRWYSRMKRQWRTTPNMEPKWEFKGYANPFATAVEDAAMSRFPSPIALEILQLLHHAEDLSSLAFHDVALALEAAVWHGRPDLCRYLIDEWLDMHYPYPDVGSVVSEMLRNCIESGRREDLLSFHAMLETRAYKRAQWERDALQHRAEELNRYDYLDVLVPIRCPTLILATIQRGMMLGEKWMNDVLAAVGICACAFAVLFLALIAVAFLVAFGFVMVYAYLIGGVLLGVLIVAISCISMSLPGAVGNMFGLASVKGVVSFGVIGCAYVIAWVELCFFFVKGTLQKGAICTYGGYV